MREHLSPRLYDLKSASDMYRARDCYRKSIRRAYDARITQKGHFMHWFVVPLLMAFGLILLLMLSG